jgi:protein TonB
LKLGSRTLIFFQFRDQEYKMSQQVTRILSAVFLLTWIVTIASGQNLTAKASSFQPAGGSGNESDRARDGLLGPVRRVRTEVVRLSTSAGKILEDDKRVLLETAEYDLKGSKTQNQYFPIAGATLTGREVYKYDDKGNISEMTLVNAEGSLVSKEVYKYDYDSVGNWVKMTTSIAVVENGKVEFEPTEATYRTIFYYLDATMAKMVQPVSNPSPVSPGMAAKTDEKSQQSRPTAATVGGEQKSQSALNTSPSPAGNESKMAAALPPPSSFLDKARVSASQPVVADVATGSAPGKKVVISADNDAPPPRPLLKPVSGGVLNGKALSLPAPVYPDVARRMHTAGLVEVEVIVDETGKVISARALSGPGILRDVAVQAALRARFTSTKLSGQPVKISGSINYNFTLPQ